MKRTILLVSLLCLTGASLSHAGILDDAAQNVLPPQEKSKYIEPTKGETITQQLSKLYSVNGHTLTTLELYNIAENGNAGIKFLRCISPLTVSATSTSMERYTQAMECNIMTSKTGVSGLDCNSCSGQWGWKGGNYKSMNGKILNMGFGTEDGYVVEASESMLTITHPSLGYRIVFSIKGFKIPNPYISNDESMMLIQNPVASMNKAIFKVIEVNIPTTVNRVTTYLKDRGNSITLNNTYRVVDEIWQKYAETADVNAISFAKTLISEPEAADSMIQAYFKK